MEGMVSIRVPYRHLNEAELELIRLDGPDANGDADLDSSRASSDVPPSSPSPYSHSGHGTTPQASPSGLKTLILGCMVAAGVQFGWALQLSLLTPYIQTLGIEHAFSSFIWLCGPITGLIVQPFVGIWSDKCHSKYGRRRPFIFVGSLLISCAVIIIGFSADIGYMLGDTKEHCRDYKGPRWRAVAVFIIGFWMLDLANNTVQGPARALLADLSGPNQRNIANGIFCSWMAVGNILGFSSGASGQWHRWFPFLTTRACCEACGNLKAAFLVAVVFLIFCTFVTLYFAKEVPLVNSANISSDAAPLLKDAHQHSREMLNTDTGISENGHKLETKMAKRKVHMEKLTESNSNVDSQVEAFNDRPSAVMVNLLTSLRHLPHGMHPVLLVMSLTWLSWFPFFLFDTDWMGREVFHGDPKGNSEEMKIYHQGVREGCSSG
uniref:Sucrose transport protein SUT4 n=1 Tax=Anthurium amnicola TaxID=1678845 RepID=A0A1D1YHK5_9ARAE